jgi:hypothetical protein
MHYCPLCFSECKQPPPMAMCVSIAMWRGLCRMFSAAIRQIRVSARHQEAAFRTWSMHAGKCVGDGQWRKLSATSETEVAEEVGFEPTNGYPLPVFKTGAFNRSATLPLTIGLLPKPLGHASETACESYSFGTCFSSNAPAITTGLQLSIKMSSLIRVKFRQPRRRHAT